MSERRSHSRLRLATAWVAVLVGISVAAIAQAGGQYVGDTGSQAMQRSGAFVAKADDPTAIFFNPSGLAGLLGKQLFVGTNLVHLSQSFSRDGSYQEQPVYPEPQPDYVADDYPRVTHSGPPQPIPFLAMGLPVGRFALGAGVFTPHGYGMRDYPDSVRSASAADAPSPQRYDTVSQTAGVALPSVAAAYRLGGGLSVGARVSWGIAWLESSRYVQGFASASEEPEKDSLVTVSARDWFAPTFGLGIHWRAAPWVQLAGSYSAPMSVNARGTSQIEMGPGVMEPAPGVENRMEPVADELARCATGGTASEIKACVFFSLPQTASLGARWIVRDALGAEVGDVEVDLRWEDWSAASDYRVVVDGQTTLIGAPLEESIIKHGLVDVVSVRIGGARHLRVGGRDYAVRAGAAYETAAAPTSWTRLDVDGGERYTGAVGFGFGFTSYRIDFGAAYIYSPKRSVAVESVEDLSDIDARTQPDVQVPINPPEQQPYHPFNAGSYRSRYLVASAGMTVWW